MDLVDLKSHIGALTPVQQRFLYLLVWWDAEQQPEGWVDRARIAGWLQKKRLTPHDIQCLHRLVELGFVETAERGSRHQVVQYAVIYRVTAWLAEWGPELLRWADGQGDEQ